MMNSVNQIGQASRPAHRFDQFEVTLSAKEKFEFFRRFFPASVNLLCDTSFVTRYFWNPFRGCRAINTLLDVLETVFERPIKLYTTQCITADVYHSDAFPCAFISALCSHDAALPPFACLADVIGHSNFGNFTIATKDRKVVELMTKRN